MARRAILIASSAPVRLGALQQSVRGAGFFPIATPTTRQALFLLTKVRPALILADATMEDGDAFAFLHDLRRLPLMEQAPLIVLGTTRDAPPEARDDPNVLVMAETDLEAGDLTRLMRETLDRLVSRL